MGHTVDAVSLCNDAVRVSVTAYVVCATVASVRRRSYDTQMVR